MGSDKRQKYLYEILCENGYTATYMNDEELEKYIRLCEYNVLLLPVSSSAIYFDKLKCILNGEEYIWM